MRSIVQKIMLQINAKLGGELWACNVPLNNAMIVGIDTYHDPTSRAGFSFTGMGVCLYDVYLGFSERYFRIHFR